MKTLFCLSFLVASFVAHAQFVVYEHDAVGNRISKVIVNNHSAQSEDNDELVVLIDAPEEAEIIQDDDRISEDGLTAKTYPNPVSDFLILENNFEPALKKEFRLVTTDGATVASGYVLDRIEIISLSALAKGTYVLTIIDEPDFKWEIIKQ